MKSPKRRSNELYSDAIMIYFINKTNKPCKALGVYNFHLGTYEIRGKQLGGVTKWKYPSYNPVRERISRERRELNLHAFGLMISCQSLKKVV